MAEMFLQISVSLDGYIEDPNGDIEWMTSDTSLAGDTKDASPDLIEQARLMNTLPKYVLTSGNERTGWANAHAIRADDVPGLKRKAKGPIAAFAGAGAQSLLARGMVDEIRLIQYPILLGAGTPLFADDGVRRRLTLTGSETFESGATLQRYRFTS